MTDTSIEWTDKTWNPGRGCSRVSAGCDHCYAMGVAHRFGGPGRPYDGLTTIRRGKVDWKGSARFVPDQLVQPLRWRKPARIFVNSMSDLFHESLSNDEIAAVFGVMAAAPQHTFQVLTKRPERMRAWFRWLADEGDGDEGGVLHNALGLALQDQEDDWDPDDRHCETLLDSCNEGWPLPHVHVGVSVENEAALWRVDELQQVPAALRFLSCEPLLGPLDLAYKLFNGADSFGTMPGIGWVIVGGESGPGARPCALEWIERIVADCRRAAVPVFVKQMGANVVSELRTVPVQTMIDLRGPGDRPLAPNGEVWAWRAGLTDRKGADVAQWPDYLGVREFPALRVGQEPAR